MSKLSDERSTPNELFNILDREFHFDIDLAASIDNHKLPVYYDKENSAFLYNWIGSCFLNPPYSSIYEWLEYASQQSKSTLVIILPCDTSTKWFHDFLWDESLHKHRLGIELRFPKGRFKFGKYKTSPKFATIIAIMRNE